MFYSTFTCSQDCPLHDRRQLGFHGFFSEVECLKEHRPYGSAGTAQVRDVFPSECGHEDNVTGYASEDWDRGIIDRSFERKIGTRSAAWLSDSI